MFTAAFAQRQGLVAQRLRPNGLLPIAQHDAAALKEYHFPLFVADHFAGENQAHLLNVPETSGLVALPKPRFFSNDRDLMLARRHPHLNIVYVVAVQPIVRRRTRSCSE